MFTKVTLDLEADALHNPTQIWVVVCKDLASGQVNIFRKITEDKDERTRFINYAKSVDLWIGHNCLEYDFPVLYKLIPLWNSLSLDELCERVTDTLILSRLIDYSRVGGHSIEAYGEEFNLHKGEFNDFTHYSPEMEIYCIRDVDICERIYLKYLKYISDPNHRPSILLEHRFQLIVNSLHNNGFCLNVDKATRLLDKINDDLAVLDTQIVKAFPTKRVFNRKVRRNLDGTLHKVDLRLIEEGKVFIEEESLFNEIPFNASSHKQVIDLLREAGWSPIEKTDTHKDIEREVNILKYKPKDKGIDLRLEECYKKLETLKIYGYRISEENLATLPKDAPGPAKLLAKRRLLKSRAEDLVEWLGLVQEDGRIHGSFLGIGAWTHRMAHRRPNMANITNEVRISDGSKTLYGGEMRALWRAPLKRLLVGVDAEAIQLRVFAHLINEPALTQAILTGKKSEGTDPHSLNQKYFGSFCKTRNAAKHSLYAIFFGGGPVKIAHIMACTKEQAKEATESLKRKYPGLIRLEKEVFPGDAKRGYFIGLDGRKVKIPGETLGDRRHLCMSGYLQNGESIIMKAATLKWHDKLKSMDAKLVNLVHDEFIVECPNSMDVALKIAEMLASSIEEAGKDLKLRCPLSGSFWKEDRGDYTIGTSWLVTH